MVGTEAAAPAWPTVVNEFTGAPLADSRNRGGPRFARFRALRRRQAGSLVLLVRLEDVSSRMALWADELERHSAVHTDARAAGLRDVAHTLTHAAIRCQTRSGQFALTSASARSGFTLFPTIRTCASFDMGFTRPVFGFRYGISIL